MNQFRDNLLVIIDDNRAKIFTMPFDLEFEVQGQ
jgi:hypothetical protein